MKIERIKDMRFVKGATALHRYHRNPAGFILSEESPERIEMRTLYERALPLALTMLDNGETHLNVAIIGRLASRSVVGALAQILIGNSLVGLDSELTTDLAHIDTLACPIAIVDGQSLSNDVDLKPFQSIRKVYFLGETKHRVFTDEDRVTTVKFTKQSVTAVERKRIREFEPEANKNQTMSYNFSSGSTGAPKCQIMKNQVPLERPQPPATGLDQRIGKWQVAKMVYALKTRGIVAAVTGNFNSFAVLQLCVYGIASTMRATFIHLIQNEPESWAPLISQVEHRVFMTFFYTPMLHVFVSTEAFKKFDLSSILFVSSGGSPLAPASRQHVINMFKRHQSMPNPDLPLVGMAYGTTEICYPMFRFPFTNDEELLDNSVGTHVKTRDFKLKILKDGAENAEECAPGEIGHIHLLSPMRIRKYLHTPSDELPFQWIDVGDMGYVDEHRNLFVTGRSKDTITLKNTKKINTVSVECIIAKCDDVIEVFVKGKANQRGYDDIHAFIHTENSQQVSAFVNTAVPSVFEVQLHFFSQRLPKLAVGKFDGVALLKTLA